MLISSNSLDLLSLIKMQSLFNSTSHIKKSYIMPLILFYSFLFLLSNIFLNIHHTESHNSFCFKKSIITQIHQFSAHFYIEIYIVAECTLKIIQDMKNY